MTLEVGATHTQVTVESRPGTVETRTPRSAARSRASHLRAAAQWTQHAGSAGDAAWRDPHQPGFRRRQGNIALAADVPIQ